MSTLRDAGLEESGWLVEFASPEQRVAAIDLDCWSDADLSPDRLIDWIDALIAAGPETLVQALDELDPELLVLALRSLGDFAIAEGDPFQQLGGATLDGLVYFDAERAEDEVRIREILGAVLQLAPAHYAWLVYGAISESPAECEELAARWRRGRLADLGFPERDHAMRVYAPLSAEAVPLPDAWEARAEAPRLPQRIAAGDLAETLALLPAQRADEVQTAILELANALAVADRLPLASSESVERSLAKAVAGVERGLAELARARGTAAVQVLASVPPIDLFRVAASLDRALRFGPPPKRGSGSARTPGRA